MTNNQLGSGKQTQILTSNLKYTCNKCFVDMTQTISNSFVGYKQNNFNGLTNKHTVLNNYFTLAFCTSLLFT